jgi:hypothetical protein
MAKKAEATSATETPRRRVGKQNSNAGKRSPDSLGASVPLRLKPSSHYVKVMLDQIFGENNFQLSSFLPP